MNRKYVILLAAGLVLLQSAVAQEIKPKEPILPRMPAKSAWTLEYGGGAQAAQPGQTSDPAQNRIAITKDGDIYRLVSEKSIGGFQEAWVIRDIVYLLAPGGERCVVADATTFPASDFSRSDFEAFQWVQAKNYIGISDLDQRKVFVFEAASLQRPLSRREQSLVDGVRQSLMGEETSSENRKVSDEEIIETLGWAPTFKATLDAQSQIPVSMESGAFRLRVRIGTGATSLSIPAAVQKRIEAGEQAQSRRPTKPAR